MKYNEYFHNRVFSYFVINILLCLLIDFCFIIRMTQHFKHYAIIYFLQHVSAVFVGRHQLESQYKRTNILKHLPQPKGHEGE